MDNRIPTDILRAARALHDIEDSWNDIDWEYLPASTQTLFCRQARAALSTMDNRSPDGVEQVQPLDRPPYCGPREYLLLSSYCGDDNDACTKTRPCFDCLAMCNVFDEQGKFLRELGNPAPLVSGRSGERMREDSFYEGRFFVATVSEDGREIGLDHPTDADWGKVRHAHIALRDRLNERLEQEDMCPYKTRTALDTPKGELK